MISFIYSQGKHPVCWIVENINAKVVDDNTNGK